MRTYIPSSGISISVGTTSVTVTTLPSASFVVTASVTVTSFPAVSSYDVTTTPPSVVTGAVTTTVFVFHEVTAVVTGVPSFTPITLSMLRVAPASSLFVSSSRISTLLIVIFSNSSTIVTLLPSSEPDLYSVTSKPFSVGTTIASTTSPSLIRK